jgi:hypothetical protein
MAEEGTVNELCRTLVCYVQGLRMKAILRTVLLGDNIVSVKLTFPSIQLIAWFPQGS